MGYDSRGGLREWVHPVAGALDTFDAVLGGLAGVELWSLSDAQVAGLVREP